MSTKKEKLMIIDGNALIHRSFHALPPTMKTKDGQMTNAVYGFTTVLIKAIRDLKPDYVALTLDRKAPTFRHEEYKEYKATRLKAPDELYEQIPLVKKVTQSFNIPIYEKDGYEADDLIGTISRQVDGQIEKIIVTGDLDTLQLVNDHTKIYTMSHGLSDSVIYDESAVVNRFGLKPEQMIDFKALRGDPSDNIPGVRGIGEKTAIELLKIFGSLEKIYEHLNKVKSKKLKVKSSKIKPRILELLIEHEKEAFLSKKLVTIKLDVPIDFKLGKAKFGNYNQGEVVKTFSELEFKSLLPRIQNLSKDAFLITTAAEHKKGGEEKKYNSKFERDQKLFKYILVDDEKKFAAFFSKLKKQKKFALDTETTWADPLTAKLLGISFSWQEKEAYYINVKTHPADGGTNVKTNLFNYTKSDFGYPESDFHPWLKQLKPILEDEKIKKYGHNIKFDLRVLRANGIDLKKIEFDTMIASYLLNPGSRQHNLDAVAFTELGFEKISKADLIGEGRRKIDFSEVPTEKLSLYSCEDADFTLRLVNKLKKQLALQKMEDLFKKIEMPLTPVLAKMEDNGILINKNFLGTLNKEVGKKIKKLEIKIKKMAGADFNINSTQQLREILFTKLGIPTEEISRTKTGLSTAAEELVKLKSHHPIINLIQDYRELAKLSSTYINALPELICKKTGRLHTSFNQTVTATGRLSSSEPNLQNIPIRTELGQKIRKAFIAEKGYQLLSLDYSQIELRLAAHLSGDKRMIKAFLGGADIHTATAAEINGLKENEVTPKMRREAKAINFGIIYGQGPHGLSQTADISYEKAREFIEEYFKVYKDVKKYIDESIALAKKRGYAETLFGRKRFLPEINSSVVQIKKAAERMAINTPLQGTAADIIKVAMIKISRYLSPYSPLLIRRGEGGEEKRTGVRSVRLLLQVHDELLFEVKKDMANEAAQQIKNIMENVIKLKVPIIVDAKIGDNWGEMEKI